MILYLYGPDSYRSRVKAEELRARFVESNPNATLNLDDITCSSTTTANELVSKVATAPFLGPTRLVIIRQPFIISATEQQALLTGLQQHADHKDSVVVVWQSGDVSDSSLHQWLCQQKAQEFKPLTIAQRHTWIHQYTHDRRCFIEPSAMKILAENFTALEPLHHLLDQLIAWRPGTNITPESLGVFWTHIPTESTFALADAVCQPSPKQLEKILHRLEASDVDSFMILGTLRWLAKTICIIHQQPGAAPAQLGLKPFVFNKYQPLARRLTTTQCQQLYYIILQADAKMKISWLGSQLILDETAQQIRRIFFEPDASASLSETFFAPQYFS